MRGPGNIDLDIELSNTNVVAFVLLGNPVINPNLLYDKSPVVNVAFTLPYGITIPIYLVSRHHVVESS